MVMHYVGITLRTALHCTALHCTAHRESNMITLSGTSELSEKERIRLQINAQVEEFLRRGGTIKAVNGSGSPAITGAGNDSVDQEEPTSLCD